MNLALLLGITLILNIPFGFFREFYKRLSWQWFLLIHAPIPFIIIIRTWLGYKLLDYVIIPVVISAILGQVIGSIINRKFFKHNKNENNNNNIS